VERRCGQRLEPGVILAADEVEGAAVEPGDEERAVERERALDVGGREAARPGAKSEPGDARILALNREEALGDCLRISGRRTGEELRRQSLCQHAAIIADLP